jgi:3-oxoacyl-[acyl-carrier protein] reductase
MSVTVDLQGQHAVVTGGANGLGLAITDRLIDCGARVSLFEIDGQAGEALAARHPGKAYAYAADVCRAAEVQGATKQAASRFGPPHILVNNAGVSGPNALTWEYDESAWRKTLEVNLTGAFLCIKAVVPYMLERRYGRIINISSVSGKDGNPMICAYAASKAGLISLTKSVGKELATTGITANCVTPGAIRTAIFDQWPEDYVQSLVAKIPMGRFGLPHELAAMVAWLSSDEASFSTGAVFDLSGGRAVY